MSLAMATKQYLTGHHQGDVVTGQVMEPVSLTSHARETLHYGIAPGVCVCVCVCESERVKETALYSASMLSLSCLISKML